MSVFRNTRRKLSSIVDILRQENPVVMDKKESDMLRIRYDNLKSRKPAELIEVAEQYIGDMFKQLKSFSDRHSKPNRHRGLLIVMGFMNEFLDLTSRLNGEILEKKYDGRSADLNIYSTDFQGFLDEVARYDGATLFDEFGVAVATRRYIENVTSRDIEIISGTGARHRAAAFSSKKVPGSISMIVSEEKGYVCTFKDGKILEEYCYDPFKEADIGLKE